MAEPVELTKKVKLYFKKKYPEIEYIEYSGTFNGKPTYAVSEIPFEQHEYVVQSGWDYFVVDENDITKSTIYAMFSPGFYAGFKRDPDIKPKPNPMAEPIEVTKKVKDFFRDSYSRVKYIGRYRGLPTYEITNTTFDFMESKFCVVNPSNIAQSKFYGWLDHEFLEELILC